MQNVALVVEYESTFIFVTMSLAQCTLIPMASIYSMQGWEFAQRFSEQITSFCEKMGE